jgi:hypothetical protein
MLFVLLLLAVSIFSSFAAGETQEFRGEVISGESIDVDDFTFIITMNKYGSAIFVDADPMFQSVEFGDCEKMESFRICFDNTTYDYDENEAYAIVRIFRSKPDVSIRKTINQTEFYVGHEAEVTITITNTGDTAPNIIMTDDYSAEVEIYDMEGGCRVHENQVYWQGHLNEDEEKQCTFLIKVTKELHRSFVAHLKYWDNFKWIDEYSSTLTLDVEPVISFYSTIVREDYEIDGTAFDYDEDNPGVNIGETLRLLVNITNEYNDHIDVDALEIHLPPNIKYRSQGHLRFNYINASGNRSSIVWYSDRITKVSDRVLRWSGRLSEGNSKLFILKLTAERTGRHSMVLNTEYEYDDMEFEADQYEAFDVVDPGIDIRMTVEDKSKRFAPPERLDDEEDSIDLESMHPYNVKVYTQNRNKYSKLESVNVEVLTDLAGFKKIHYSEMDEEGQRIPYSIVLIPPYVESSKAFKMNVSASFKNEYGEMHYNSTEFSITVLPSKDLTIDIDSSEGDVLEGGEETEITVSVNNDRLIDIRNVEVKDVISEELHVEGVHSKRVKLNKESDTDIYRYRITPPIVHTKTRYNITTTVSYFDPDLRQTLQFSKTKTITVEPLKPDVTLDVTLDEPDDIYPGTLIPVEYVVRNDEEEELIRGITVFFPIQEEIDFIGPRTFLIDKLDPGEEVTIKNLVKIRPKVVSDSLNIEKTAVEYYDNYGNLFDENSSDDTIDVDSSKINGPAIFMRTLVPDVINRSSDGVIRIEIKNEGTLATDLTVEQGDRIWNATVAAGSTEIIEYTVKYDQEGNYTIPPPIAKMRFQGLEAYTKGQGATAKVELLLGLPAEVVEEEVPVVEEVEEIVEEKEEVTFEEYEAEKELQQRKIITKYALIGILAIIVLVLVFAYLGYQKRKGPAHPFMEVEKP